MLHIVTDVAVCAMDFTVESLHPVEKEFRSVTEQVLKAMKISSSSELTQSVIMRSNKDVIANCLKSVVTLLEKNMDLCKSAAAENDKLKSEQIQNQKEITSKYYLVTFYILQSWKLDLLIFSGH